MDIPFKLQRQALDAFVSYILIRTVNAVPYYFSIYDTDKDASLDNKHTCSLNMPGIDNSSNMSSLCSF